MKPLYSAPDILRQVFPFDDEEAEFWRAVAGCSGRILDLGAGATDLAAVIGGAGIALDQSAELLRGNPARNRVKADVAAIPLQAASVDTLVSRLFGISYAVASDPTVLLPRVANELVRVVAPGGAIALELPVAFEPRKLIGLEETFEDSMHSYSFVYFDAVREHEFGCTVEARIQVRSDGDAFELIDPLFVFTPAGVKKWAASVGRTEVQFYACYDFATATDTPPHDVLRAVVIL